MDSTQSREDRREGKPGSSRRRWAILLGAVILLVVLFDLLERIVPPDTQSALESASDSALPLEPIRPEIARRGRAGVVVEVEGGHRITTNLDDEAQADHMIACLEEGVATSPAFTDGEAGQPPTSTGRMARSVRARQVWNEVIRIHNVCTMSAILSPSQELP